MVNCERHQWGLLAGSLGTFRWARIAPELRALEILLNELRNGRINPIVSIVSVLYECMNGNAENGEVICSLGVIGGSAICCMVCMR